MGHKQSQSVIGLLRASGLDAAALPRTRPLYHRIVEVIERGIARSALAQGYGWGFRYAHGFIVPFCLLAGLGADCAALQLGRKCAVISDPNVAPRYAKPALASLKRAGFDPALMSNPVIASLVDVTGIVLYFAIAKTFLL